MCGENGREWEFVFVFLKVIIIIKEGASNCVTGCYAKSNPHPGNVQSSAAEDLRDCSSMILAGPRNNCFSHGIPWHHPCGAGFLVMQNVRGTRSQWLAPMFQRKAW